MAASVPHPPLCLPMTHRELWSSYGSIHGEAGWERKDCRPWIQLQETCAHSSGHVALYFFLSLFFQGEGGRKRDGEQQTGRKEQ